MRITSNSDKLWPTVQNMAATLNINSKPSDFGLTPPTSPRAGKTLCDKSRDFSRAEALQLLNDGFVRGMVSVSSTRRLAAGCLGIIDNATYEAQLENQAEGVFDGFPISVDEDFRRLVLLEWNRRG